MHVSITHTNINVSSISTYFIKRTYYHACNKVRLVLVAHALFFYTNHINPKTFEILRVVILDQEINRTKADLYPNKCS